MLLYSLKSLSRLLLLLVLIRTSAGGTVRKEEEEEESRMDWGVERWQDR